MTITFPAKAENINGTEFNIPEEWSLVDSVDDDISSRTYVCDNQVVMVVVANAGLDIMLMDCDSAFGEEDGYYLMRDLSEKSEDGHMIREQECVYESDGWYYTFLCGVNTGDAAVSIAYAALTTGDHSQIVNYFDLVDDFIPGIG